MSSTDVRSELRAIAEKLPQEASYADAMYELYVRMKVAAGREAVAAGRVTPQAEIRAKFAR